MADPTEEEPQQKPNLLKARRKLAWERAEDAVEAISPSGGNPLDGPGTSITNGAWESPDAAAFVTDLTGDGAAIKTAFTEAESHLNTMYTSEPDTVTVPGPQEWKADPARVGSYR